MSQGRTQNEIRKETNRLFVEGEELTNDEQYSKALDRFQSAWNLLLNNKELHDELAVQVLGAIADCYFFLRAWDKCRETVQQAFRLGAELDDVFLRLRLGQSLYEQGEEREAANWLVPVYLTEGRKPFEMDDPKYLEFFRGRLQTPKGGWPEGW